MDLADFQITLNSFQEDEKFYDFCRKHILHGVPYVFQEREDYYYEFRKRVANKFNISFHEVYITGSGKLGFSPFKKKIFDLDSDIDVAIISSNLFEEIMWKISEFQMNYRNSRTTVQEYELKKYHDFLEYVAIGWIRPDKLPVSFQMRSLKDDWFGFFNSISYNQSEVGNYKVSAGVFKTYQHFENYIVNGFQKLRTEI